MKSPCELIVWYLLPAIRSELAKELKKQRFKQTEIAEKLGVTPAAVSHYMSDKRTGGVELSEDAKVMIKELTQKIVGDEISEFNIMENICTICVKARRSGLLCEIHRIADPEIPKKCEYWSKFDKCILSECNI